MNRPAQEAGPLGPAAHMGSVDSDRVLAVPAAGWGNEREGSNPSTPPILAHMLAGLRGRYLLAITLSAVCAAIFGALGWFVARPTYRSESLVRIAYTMPEVLQETDRSRPI